MKGINKDGELIELPVEFKRYEVPLIDVFYTWLKFLPIAGVMASLAWITESFIKPLFE